MRQLRRLLADGPIVRFGEVEPRQAEQVLLGSAGHDVIVVVATTAAAYPRQLRGDVD